MCMWRNTGYAESALPIARWQNSSCSCAAAHRRRLEARSSSSRQRRPASSAQGLANRRRGAGSLKRCVALRAFPFIRSPHLRRATRTSLPTTMRCSLLNRDTARPSDSSTAWMWCPMLGQASTLSRHTTRLWSPVPPTSAKSLTAPKTPWVGNTVSSGSLRRVVQSNSPARSSRRLLCTKAEWSLHNIPSVVAGAFDGSGDRQGQAGACRVGKIRPGDSPPSWRNPAPSKNTEEFRLLGRFRQDMLAPSSSHHDPRQTTPECFAR
jgi:hypothetical protein